MKRLVYISLAAIISCTHISAQQEEVPKATQQPIVEKDENAPQAVNTVTFMKPGTRIPLIPEGATTEKTEIVESAGMEETPNPEEAPAIIKTEEAEVKKEIEAQPLPEPSTKPVEVQQPDTMIEVEAEAIPAPQTVEVQPMNQEQKEIEQVSAKAPKHHKVATCRPHKKSSTCRRAKRACPCD